MVMNLGFNVSPTASAYFSVAMAIVGVLAAMSPSLFPSYLPPGVVADVTQTAGFITTLWGGVNAVLHAVSSTAPGPLSADAAAEAAQPAKRKQS